MGRGSHLLAENVGGCTSGQRFATPYRRDTGECQLTFYVAWTVLWLGFVVSPAAPFVFLLLGFDFLPVFLFSSVCSSSAHNTGSGNSRARVRSVERFLISSGQLSNSHSRMVAGLPVRRSIIRHGFTELLSRGKRLFLAFLPGLLPCGLFRRLLGSFLLIRRLSSRLQSRRSARGSG